MVGSRGTIGHVVALVLLAPGCTSSPWWAGRTAPDAADPPPAETSPDRSTVQPPAASQGANAGSTDELHVLMAELQQLGALDPKAQQQLTQDLQQSDPAMRKPLVECLRAALASQRRAQRRGRAPADEAPAAGEGAPEKSRPARSAEAAAPPRQDTRVGPPEKEQAAVDARPEVPDRSRDNPGSGRPNKPGQRGPDEKVVAAGFDSPADDAWQDHLAAAIRGLESQVSPAPKTETEVARHAYLRLLCLAAGRRDDALRPIPSVPPGTQEFWASELYGLERWLNVERTADPADRAAEAKKSLDEAASRLGESAPLVVRGLAFATEIQSYGCYTPFAKHEFGPEQEVLLYAEVENFTSERTPKGFHTSFRSSYKVFDSGGHQVAEHEFPVIEEVCHCRRRDFFIGYHLRLPRRIFAGRHTLRLTIEDLKKGQIGQTSIDFTVKAARE